MSWWKRLWANGTSPSSPQRPAVRLTMPGWVEEAASGDKRLWWNSQGDVLSLSIQEASLDSSEFSSQVAAQQWSRRLAESNDAGLIEAHLVTGTLGPALSLIYKRLQMPAYIFTGMLLLCRHDGFQIWTVVSGERGTTGVREAVITAELMSAGELTLEDYERSWAQDPYQPTYRGVDRSVLRFVSDDERYDERFAEHPLSKVRQVLSALPYSVQIEPPAPEL